MTNRDVRIMVILGILSLLVHTATGRMDIAEWPAQDTWAFFMRQADPGFAPGDFYTDSVMRPNPRHVFGWAVIGLAKILGTEWWGALWVLKCVFVVCLPPLFYWAILVSGFAGGLWKPTDRTRDLLGIGVALVSCWHRLDMWVSVGLWSPFYTLAHPQTLSVALVLASLLPVPRPIPLVFLISATLVHPAMGLYTMVFLMLLARSFEWKALVFGWAIPALAIKSMYMDPSPLSDIEFVRIYAHELHGFHYVPSLLASNTRFPWWVPFSAVFLALLRVPRMAAAYVGCVVVSWLGLEVTLSRTVAELGPVRFTQFGPWMALAALVGWAERRRGTR